MASGVPRRSRARRCSHTRHCRSHEQFGPWRVGGG
jgi:hypothetical protein